MQHAFGDRNDKTVSFYTFSSVGINTENISIANSTSDSVPNTITGGSTCNVIYQEERIDLGLPKRKTVYLSPQEVINYQPPENHLIRVVIRGTTAEMKAIMKMERIKELRKLVCKIAFKTVKEGQPLNDELEGDKHHHDEHNFKAQKSYLQCLYDEIKGDEELKSCYHDIFGMPLV